MSTIGKLIGSKTGVMTTEQTRTRPPAATPSRSGGSSRTRRGHEFLIGDEWLDAPRGTFVLVPGGVTRDFQNRSDARTGALNFTNGVFEPAMKGIAQWFAKHPPKDVLKKANRSK